MYTFQGLYSGVQTLVNDTDTTTLTNIKAWINQTQHLLLALNKDFTEKSSTATTTASTAAYDLPHDYGKMFSVTITVSSVAYEVRPIEDESFWRRLVARSYTSSIPQFYYISNDQITFYPTPAASSNTITYYYHKKVKDLTAADYTTGTVSALTNGASAVTGAGTTWTAAMVGRYLRITSDGIWYEIESRSTDTAIVIKKAFAGTTITAGSEAYTIGELPTIPEAYHELLLWRPAALYYMQKGEDAKAQMYWQLYDGGYSIGRRDKPGAMVDMLINDRSSKVESAIIDSDLVHIKKQIGLTNPNDFPSDLS